jgi:hypothetical protein
VLDVLEVQHDLEPLPLRERVVTRRREQLREHASWVRGSAAPWVHRRLTGRSSGDTVSPRHPTLGRVGPGGAQASI